MSFLSSDHSLHNLSNFRAKGLKHLQVLYRLHQTWAYVHSPKINFG